MLSLDVFSVSSRPGLVWSECIKARLGPVCDRHLSSQLAEMEKMIDRMMQEDFVRHATMDLNRPLADGDSLVEEVRHQTTHLRHTLKLQLF